MRLFASDHPERAARLVLVDASHEDDAHEVPGMARFVPLLSTLGVFRLLGVVGQRVESLPPSVQRYAQATRFRAAGYQAAADEIMHMGETVSEVRNTRRKLTIPVLVVTGARGADEHWRRLQLDEASLSERGCLITAQQSGHVEGVFCPYFDATEADVIWIRIQQALSDAPFPEEMIPTARTQEFKELANLYAASSFPPSRTLLTAFTSTNRVGRGIAIAAAYGGPSWPVRPCSSASA